MFQHRNSIAVFVAVALAACVSSSEDEARPQEAASPAVFDDRAEPGALRRAWTTRFRERGLLVANRIRIEGPAAVTS